MDTETEDASGGGIMRRTAQGLTEADVKGIVPLVMGPFWGSSI